MQGLVGSCLRQLERDRRLRAVVLLAGLGSLAFSGLHVAHVLAGTRLDPGFVLLRAGLAQPELSLKHDNGYAEAFGYLLLVLGIVALARLGVTTRRPVYVAFLLIFLYGLLDDALRIHERLGRALAGWLDLPPAFGLRAHDLGELATWTAFGIPLLGFLGWALRRSAGRDRSAGLALAGALFVLAFFGVGVDVLSAASRGREAAHQLFSFVEEAGELAGVTGFLALILAVPAYLREGGSRGSPQGGDAGDPRSGPTPAVDLGGRDPGVGRRS